MKVKVCEICGREIRVNNYQQHLSGHKNHPEKYKDTNGKYKLTHEGLICQFCGKECKNRNSLCNHERLCKSNPDRQIQKFELSENKIFICPICGKEFKSQFGLWSHSINKHPVVKLICEECGREFTNNGALQSHIKQAHTLKDIKVNCQFCNQEFTSAGIAIHEKYCLLNPNRVDTPKQTEESKEKIRQARLSVLEEYPEQQQLWKYRKSYCCDTVKDFLKENGLTFKEEYTDKSWDRYFSLDIAFVENKLDVEVNGSMHYDREGNLLPYYQERHDFLINNGWNVIEFPAEKAFSDANKIMLLEEINNYLSISR